jgi:hypothetical protein
VSSSPETTLQRLQRWFASNCDQEWEHDFGVKIETLDNPGWLVQIDLIGTPLCEANFEPVEVGDHDGLKPARQVGCWMACRIHERSPYVTHQRQGPVWIGTCSTDWLEHMLTIFLDWAEANTPPNPNSMP